MVAAHRVYCNANIIWHGADVLWSIPFGAAMA